MAKFGGCHVCGKHPADGFTVYRQNAKGVPGIYACEEHDTRKDAETHRVVAELEASDPGRSRH